MRQISAEARKAIIPQPADPDTEQLSERPMSLNSSFPPHILCHSERSEESAVPKIQRKVLGHVPAAVRAYGLASHEIAFGQHHGDAPNLVGRAEKSDRQARRRSIRIRCDHVRLD